MNKQELDAIRERCEKATPGPWQEGRHDMATHVDGDASKWIYAGDKYLAISSSLDIEPWDQVIANAEFIAHARTDIPTLLAEIDRLTAEQDAIGKLCLKAPSWGISAGRFAVELAKVLDGGLEGRG